MTDFVIRFFICNMLICGLISLLLVVKHLFRNHLSNRMQYNLWFLMMGLLAIPFLPVQPMGYTRLFSWFDRLKDISGINTQALLNMSNMTQTVPRTDLMNDLTLSVSRVMPSFIGKIILGIWLMGVLTMIILVIKSKTRLKSIEDSALPLQNKRVRKIYQGCLDESNVAKNIPIYSTAFLRSPIIVGLLHPRIYIPIQLLSDHTEKDLRFMLLHELQHYKYMDALVNYLMNLAGILYWFNPAVWYGLKVMRTEREVACDTCVLNMLKEHDYEDYGITLINFAEKISNTPFSFASGMGGNMYQIKRRILNIAFYEKPSLSKRIRSIIFFIIASVILAGTAPILSTYAADKNHYPWDSSEKNITYTDFSNYFKEFDGSFVLYDLKSNDWTIYNAERANLRVSPNSTYKIYDALFGLEAKVITPENSNMGWNNKIYPIEEWNQDQNLQSAMQYSVNWYFQEIDANLGRSAISNYIQEIGYGNQNSGGDLSSYWLESTLKISPVEQVELLTKLYKNTLDFAPENMQAVKNSMLISSAKNRKLHGKSGTGRIDGQDVNGWFVGYVEDEESTYLFATNILGRHSASGSSASAITLSLLSDLAIYIYPGDMPDPLPAVQPD